MITTMSMGFVAGAGWTVVAHAAPADVTICAEYQVDYADADLASYDEDFQGDYFHSNADKAARGARIAVIGPSGAELKYADWGGGTAGCAEFDLDTTVTYDVQIHSIAQIDGNTIKVMDNADDLQVWYSTALDNWSPTGSGTVDIATANTHAAWNVAAAAGYAIWRADGGMSNKTFDFYTEYDACDLPGETAPDCNQCGDEDFSCSKGDDVFLSAEGVSKRFVMIHEMGHVHHWFKRGSARTDRDPDADFGDCYTDAGRAHEMHSKEWQSTAIMEGWAHFYAAVAFNDTSETNCGFVYYKDQDYDLDFTVDGGEIHEMSCEDGPNNLFGLWPPVVDDKDYLGDWCIADDDHATELDWLRFWWDFLSEESTVSFEDCAAILASATTGTYEIPPLGEWDPSDEDNVEDNRPYVRMAGAAAGRSLAGEWGDHVDNGIDR